MDARRWSMPGDFAEERGRVPQVLVRPRLTSTTSGTSNTPKGQFSCCRQKIYGFDDVVMYKFKMKKEGIKQSKYNKPLYNKPLYINNSLLLIDSLRLHPIPTTLAI